MSEKRVVRLGLLDDSNPEAFEMATFIKRPDKPALVMVDTVKPLERVKPSLMPALKPINRKPAWGEVRDVFALLCCGALVGGLLVYAWLGLR